MIELGRIVRLVEENCATAYFAAEHYDNHRRQIGKQHGSEHRPFKTIGCDVNESDLLYYLCCYHEEHYSRHNPFLPKYFRTLMHDRNGRRGRLPLRQLHLLHYKVNMSALRKKAKLSEKWEDFDSKQWAQDFSERFKPATVIWPLFTGIGQRNDDQLPYLIGRRDVQQQIMNFLKEDPENIFQLYREIADTPGHIDDTAEQARELHICDLLARPREVHFGK